MTKDLPAIAAGKFIPARPASQSAYCADAGGYPYPEALRNALLRRLGAAALPKADNR